MIRIAQPIIGPEEEEAVLAALRSGHLAQGPLVAQFEEAFASYLGVRHAVAVSSGTAALYVALRAHDIGPGDEVLVPAFTFAATGNAVLLAGARPVLIDIRDDDFTSDAERIEAAITPRTRAVLPVHLYGHPCDMSAIGDIARRRGVFVIEDAAQAAGASWQGRKAGSFGTGCFSFYATKNMTTGEGGMVVTDDDEVARRARLLRDHGEGERYRTDLLGGNFRMAEMAAALGLAQLAKLDGWNERRRANAAWLGEHLEGVGTPVERPAAYHVYHQYTVRVSSSDPKARLQPGSEARDRLQAHLRQREIEALVYYPRCLHQQPLYQQLGIGGSFPVAERAAEEVLSLPVHPALSQQGLERIAAAVNEATAAVGVERG
jgi:dTDP-4-amino-4,6-dideoxygalactose transaminase